MGGKRIATASSVACRRFGRPANVSLRDARPRDHHSLDSMGSAVMRKLIFGLTFILAAVLCIAASGPAKATGNWTDFSLPGQTPWCGGGGCASLHDSCMSAAYSWWASDP